MRKISLLLLLLMLSYVSCTEEDDLGPPDEEFAGTYMVRDITQVIDMAKIDSVIFSTKRNTTYSMLFYKSSPTDPLVDFCFCEGTMLDFGTAKVSFDPTTIIREHCDTLRIPRGLFEADFRNHGDTVYIEKSFQTISNTGHIDADSLFRLKLIKIK